MRPATCRFTFPRNRSGQMLDRASRQIIGVVAFAAAMLSGSAPSHASNADHGKRLALTHCARCHAIDKVSPSPLAIAPPFRILHERYPIETLQAALAEGIVT